MSAAFLDACAAAIGRSQVLTQAHDKAPYLTDWRKRYRGDALAVLRPANTDEVAALLRLCAVHGIAVVPQGGNTSLCGAATPQGTRAQIVLSLQRMRTIRDIDPLNHTITAEAGCILAEVQQAAAAVDRLLPLSLAAEGSCTLGGNLSTNAGGTAVLRYGNARELCLGLEVVTAQGEIWNGLRSLRKDNTGYDLRDLFVGAEGTLGIITAAVMKLYPQPRVRVTALAALASPRAALHLLELAQQRTGPLLTGFELMSNACLELVARHYPKLRYPFAAPHAQAVLLELSDPEDEVHARAVFEHTMEEAFERGWIADALVAESVSQSRTFWDLREHIPLAQADEGKNIKHDIALPISRIADFLDATDVALAQAFPDARLITFGHLGDGNLHYNVAPPSGVDAEAFLAHEETINAIVYDNVQRCGGSISAEHGIGQLKRDTLPRFKSAVELRMMAAIKQALDPQNLMNPGKVLKSG